MAAFCYLVDTQQRWNDLRKRDFIFKQKKPAYLKP